MRASVRIDSEMKKSKPRVKKKYGCLDLVVGKGNNTTSIPIR